MRNFFENIPPSADLSGFDELIDVRAPIEFAEDHLSGAINLPVLEDSEREEVGTIYKQESSFAAKQKGAGLVSANIARQFEAHFSSKPRDYRPLVYCWRGGQRSASLATVLAEVGWEVGRLEGGYKAYRSHVVERLERAASEFSFVVLNGYTGAGKTRVLGALAEFGEQVVDLEGAANHKGSVFGGDPDHPQPAQKRFESLLFDAFSRFEPGRPVYVEAESAKIGRLNLPNPLWQTLKKAPVIEIESPVEARAIHLLEDYEEWLDQLERVHATIERLSGFHANETLSRWKELTREGKWNTFVEELLHEHYDQRYKIGGTGNYEAPDATILLPAHDPDSVAQAAVEIRKAASTQVLASKS
ncbi:MAG: tRNA 2-selenouridine(34) synthase MnmH [Verrucomicrobiota bacterium]